MIALGVARRRRRLPGATVEPDAPVATAPLPAAGRAPRRSWRFVAPCALRRAPRGRTAPAARGSRRSRAGAGRAPRAPPGRATPRAARAPPCRPERARAAGRRRSTRPAPAGARASRPPRARRSCRRQRVALACLDDPVRCRGCLGRRARRRDLAPSEQPAALADDCSARERERRRATGPPSARSALRRASTGSRAW